MAWVNIKDQLPPEKSDFIGTDGEVIFAAYWVEDVQSYKTGGWESCVYCGGSSMIQLEGDKRQPYHKLVTHWMPLPEVPKDV